MEKKSDKKICKNLFCWYKGIVVGIIPVHSKRRVDQVMGMTGTPTEKKEREVQIVPF